MQTDLAGLVTRLSAIRGRAACSDAERRAARLLAREVRACGRAARIETFWVRPAAGAVHSIVAVLGVAASVLSVERPRLGLSIVLVALLVLADDLDGRVGVLRRLMAARATQNVVASSERQAPVRLIVTAPLDAPRMAVLGTGALARAEALARRALRGHLVGPHGLLIAALLAIAALCGIRSQSDGGVVIGLIQIIPTSILLLGAAGFSETAVVEAAPGANAHASAAAVAIELVRQLDASPPQRLAVDLVLAGAGEPEALGFRHELRARRRAGTRRDNVVVLQIAPCGAGTPVWWTREGRVLPLRYHHELVELCERVAREQPRLGARPHETRRASGARAARALRWPAIAIGCVDAGGAAPRAGEESDVAEAIDAASMQAALEVGLALVRSIDTFLGGQQAPEAQMPVLGAGASPE
jgi:hypothetical protein